jgi:predicted RNase H-like nuclease (RuvC/YqgF family)
MNEPRSRTFQHCKEFADEMRLVLPSLMNREDLETKFSKLSLYLACCSRLAQQMEELAESMRKNIELHKVLSNNKTDLLAAKQEIIEDLTKQLNDKIKKLREDWWYTEQARTLEKMGHLRNPDKALTCGDWADACSLDAAIESLRSEGEQR